MRVPYLAILNNGKTHSNEQSLDHSDSKTILTGGQDLLSIIFGNIRQANQRHVVEEVGKTQGGEMA
jgi:hypothetical protein